MKTLLIVVLLVLAVLIIYRSRAPQKQLMLPMGNETASTTLSATSTAYFAGGCFWCTEADFEKLPGVLTVTSGYTGGHKEKPTYEEVSAHRTGHVEAVKVVYDPTKVTYQDLLNYFFAHVDPTDPDGQFVDRGESYVSAIFYTTPEEQQLITSTVAALQSSGVYDKPIVTTVTAFTKFWDAEEYHQDYATKNPVRYKYYRGGSGRDTYITNACNIRSAKGLPCYGADKSQR